jgi:hypothetical protein
MAKITIQRIFETTKALATEAGQSLQDFINFNAQFAEITLRALRNGLTYADNMDCEIRSVSLTHNVNQLISVKRRPTEVRVRRVFDPAFALSAPLQWGFAAGGDVFLKAVFTPAPTTPITVEIIILY